MKKLGLFLFVTVFAFLAAIVLWFSLGKAGEDSPAPNIPGSEQPASKPAGDAKLESAQVTLPTEQTPPSIAEAPSQRSTIELNPARELPADKRCTLAVRVTMPAGVPRDDGAELVVLGVIPDDTDVDFELARLRSGDSAPKWLLARAPLDPSGSNEIALERGSSKVGVGLRARYTFAQPAFDIDVSGERADAKLDATLGACVRGRLVPPADATDSERELAGTKVNMNSDPLSAIGVGGSFDRSKLVERNTASQSDGSFEMNGVNAVKELSLSGRPPHLAAFKLTLGELSAGKLMEVAVPLVRGATATGRVLDESGAGVADAKITARADAIMFGQGGRVVRETKSGSDGAFTLEAVAAGKTMVDVSADGYLNNTQTIEFVEGARTENLVLKLSGGARIEGRVRWVDGTTVADAKVEIGFDEAHMMGMDALNAQHGGKGSGRTDAQGHFSVSGLGKGPFSVKASAKPAGADEAHASPAWTAQVDDVKPGTVGVELTLKPPSDLSGRVVDDVGAAVAECTVVVAPKRRNPWIPSSDAHEVEVRDEQGRFAVPGLMPGIYTAMARDKSGASSLSQELELPREDGAAELVITLPRPATVTGIVLGPDGSPMAQAKVSRQLGMTDIMGGKLPGTELGQMSATDGTFKIQSLPMGPLVLQATKAGFAPSEGVALKLVPAQQVSDITLTLRLGGTITGEIYDEDGTAKRGARILAQMPDLRFGQLWAQADGSGKFSLEHVAPGQWQVMCIDDAMAGAASGDGGDAADDAAAATSKMLKNLKLSTAKVIDGETVHVVLGARAKDPVHVRAIVTTAKEPVAGAMVSFIPRDGKKAGGAIGGLKLDSTDKGGRFELDLDHAGGYLITVQKVSGRGSQQSIEFSREVPEQPEYSLELELPVGAISGRVTDSAGDPVAGTRISLGVDGPVRAGTLTGGRFSEVQTDERGEYSLDWLSPGRYTVAAGGALFPGLFSEKEPLGREVRDGIEVSEGQRVDRVDFRLKAACELHGKVLDGAGKPVSEAAIFVRDEQGRPVERLSMTTTDAGGGFTQRGLSAGRYTVSARSSTLVSSEDAGVVLHDGEAGEVELHLVNGTIVLVTITGAEGEDVEASCSVVDDKGRQMNGLFSLADIMSVMNEGGFNAKEQRIGPLAPGEYKVSATMADGKQVSKSISLHGQTERKVTLKLGK